MRCHEIISSALSSPNLMPASILEALRLAAVCYMADGGRAEWSGNISTSGAVTGSLTYRHGLRIVRIDIEGSASDGSARVKMRVRGDKMSIEKEFKLTLIPYGVVPKAACMPAFIPFRSAPSNLSIFAPVDAVKQTVRARGSLAATEGSAYYETPREIIVVDNGLVRIVKR